MRIQILIAILILTPSILTAQSNKSIWSKAGKSATETKNQFNKKIKKGKELKSKIENWGLDTAYKKAFLLSGKLNTNGWSGGGMYIKRKSYATNLLLSIYFSEVKHDKQVKQQGNAGNHPELGNPTQYVFGKINNLYTLQLGMGREQLLLSGAVEGNINVSLRTTAGISLAMLKPYYLRLRQTDYSTTPETTSLIEAGYTQQDSALFMNPNMILGAAKWQKSLPYMRYITGAFIDVAIILTPGKTKTFIQSIALGINGSLYTHELPIMQGQIAFPYVINAYAGIGIGKRW